MALATLHFRGWRNAQNDQAAREWLDAYRRDLAQVHDMADELSTFYRIGGGKGPRQVTYLGRRWTLDVPLGVNRDLLYKWSYDAERLLNYYW